MPKGYLLLVLHAHLPYVRHPEWDGFLEERWLFEAITETYIPLVVMSKRLAAERVPARFTLSLSPPLVAMLEDPLLQDRYVAHLDKTIELAAREQDRTRNDPHFHYLAGYYHELFTRTKRIFTEECGCRLTTAFRRLHEEEAIELITCTATHGLLPLLAGQPKTVVAQIRTGLDYFEAVMGFRSRGIWLPECGFYPGLDEILRQEGIRFFFTENHGIDHASVNPFHGVHAPLFTPAGVAAFGRDQGSSKQVWSAREGYPGDPAYREFYRDIGHDLDHYHIGPYIAGDIRVDTGFKYYRITGPTAWKEPYYPDAAREKAAAHAGDFLTKRMAHMEYLAAQMTIPPVIVAPFDAELFGHWWFEGPQWLDFLIRKAAYDQKVLELTTPSAYLQAHPVHQTAMPATSTWGHKGYFEVWLNEGTDWIYPLLQDCGRRMEALVSRHGGGKRGTRKARALTQCGRELLLAQSSDWPFIIRNGTSAQYASRRVRDHVARFRFLAAAIDNVTVNEESLRALEEMDNIFPDFDYRLFG